MSVYSSQQRFVCLLGSFRYVINLIIGCNVSFQATYYPVSHFLKKSEAKHCQGSIFKSNNRTTTKLESENMLFTLFPVWQSSSQSDAALGVHKSSLSRNCQKGSALIGPTRALPPPSTAAHVHHSTDVSLSDEKLSVRISEQSCFCN